MPIDRQTFIAEQSQFYRDGYRRLFVLVFLLLIVGFGLLGIIIYQHINRPIPKYFATTSDGRLIEIKPIQ